jgi:hypothetical protein
VQRWFTLVAAVLSTAIFVGIRDTLDLEESRFIFALLACSTLALWLSVVSGTFLRGSKPSSLLFLGCAAFLLVPLLYGAYLVLYVVSVCMIGGQTCYS